MDYYTTNDGSGRNASESGGNSEDDSEIGRWLTTRQSVKSVKMHHLAGYGEKTRTTINWNVSQYGKWLLADHTLIN